MMDSLVIFLAGYALGSKSGSKGWPEVVKAATAVKDSEEFRSMLRVLRSHVGHTLREVGDILERAQRLVGHIDPRTKASGTPGPTIADGG